MSRLFELSEEFSAMKGSRKPLNPLLSYRIVWARYFHNIEERQLLLLNISHGLRIIYVKIMLFLDADVDALKRFVKSYGVFSCCAFHYIHYVLPKLRYRAASACRGTQR